MTSLIFRTAARALLPLMILLSVIVLLRGHNEPGGGFVGGLLFAAGFSLFALAQGLNAARRMLRVDPSALIGFGLSLAALSGIPGLLWGDAFLDGQWFLLPVAGFQEDIKVGTPVFFDIGVYFAVAGVVLMMIFSLEDYHNDHTARA
ncbi:MAG: Na+/H+ antiporter subunit B [Planctomycetota bacterium]